MAPALAPALIGQEAAACALLGLVLGSVRAVFPVRGRAAFLPDMAFVGAVLLGLQSYAAALSAGGVLRAKKKRKKTEKELAKHTAVVV